MRMRRGISVRRREGRAVSPRLRGPEIPLRIHRSVEPALARLIGTTVRRGCHAIFSISAVISLAPASIDVNRFAKVSILVDSAV